MSDPVGHENRCARFWFSWRRPAGGRAGGHAGGARSRHPPRRAGELAALAAGRGAEFHALPFDVVKQLHEPETEALFSAGGNPIAFLRWFDKTGRKRISAIAPAALEGTKGADLIVATGLMDELGGMLAERLKVPCVHACLQPMLAARDFLFASGETAPPRLPGWAQRSVFLAYEQAMWLVTRRVLSHARELTGCRPRRLSRR